MEMLILLVQVVGPHFYDISQRHGQQFPPYTHHMLFIETFEGLSNQTNRKLDHAGVELAPWKMCTDVKKAYPSIGQLVRSNFKHAVHTMLFIVKKIVIHLCIIIYTLL